MKLSARLFLPPVLVRFGHYTGTNTAINASTPADSVRQRLAPLLEGVADGADGLELDIRPMETPTLNPKTKSLMGSVADNALFSLNQLLANIPADTHLYLELKSNKVFLASKGKQIEKAIVEFIQQNNLYHRVTVVGFTLRGLRTIKKMDSKIQTGFGISYPPYQKMNERIADRAHKRGVPIMTWVCGQTRPQEKAMIEGFLKAGVDGVFTNAVDALRVVVSEAVLSSGGQKR